MNYIIYKHTLIAESPHKGWSYIGQTCRAEDPNLRWCNGKGYTKCRKFYNAIKKYGWIAFSHEILAEVSTPEEADKLESEYIKKYDSINNGYNITLGGAGRHNYKPILQMDLNKNIIARFNSVSEAELELGLPFRHSNITSCCNKKQITSHGYCWCYEEDYLDYQIKEKNYKKTRTTKKVYQLLKDKTIVAIYPSTLAAYKAISGKNNAKSAEAIKGCCQGLRKSAYNYFWCYADDYDQYKITLSYHQIKVAQINPNTGEQLTVYKNISEAAKSVNTTSSSIGQVCRGKRKTAKGYSWKFVSLEEDIKGE